MYVYVLCCTFFLFVGGHYTLTKMTKLVEDQILKRLISSFRQHTIRVTGPVIIKIRLVTLEMELLCTLTLTDD